eukprot:scaffold1669_cov129-Cylindrotheca_fusiformis.AAC.69
MIPVLEHKRPYSTRSSTPRIKISGIALSSKLTTVKRNNELQDTPSREATVLERMESGETKKDNPLISSSSHKRKMKMAEEGTKQGSRIGATKRNLNHKENCDPSSLPCRDNLVPDAMSLPVVPLPYQGRLTRSKSSSTVPPTTIADDLPPKKGVRVQKGPSKKEKKSLTGKKTMAPKPRARRCGRKQQSGRNIKARKTTDPQKVASPKKNTAMDSDLYGYDPSCKLLNSLDSRNLFGSLYFPVHQSMPTLGRHIEHLSPLTPKVKLSFRGPPTSVSPITPVSKQMIHHHGSTQASFSSFCNEGTPVARNPRIGEGKRNSTATTISQSQTEILDVMESPSKLASICSTSPSSFEPIPVYAWSCNNNKNNTCVDSDDWMVEYFKFAKNLHTAPCDFSQNLFLQDFPTSKGCP